MTRPMRHTKVIDFEALLTAPFEAKMQAYLDAGFLIDSDRLGPIGPGRCRIDRMKLTDADRGPHHQMDYNGCTIAVKFENNQTPQKTVREIAFLSGKFSKELIDYTTVEHIGEEGRESKDPGHATTLDGLFITLKSFRDDDFFTKAQAKRAHAILRSVVVKETGYRGCDGDWEEILEARQYVHSYRIIRLAGDARKWAREWQDKANQKLNPEISIERWQNWVYL